MRELRRGWWPAARSARRTGRRRPRTRGWSGGGAGAWSSASVVVLLSAMIADELRQLADELSEISAGALRLEVESRGPLVAEMRRTAEALRDLVARIDRLQRLGARGA